MATNKKFRIQNGANIEGELSFNNTTVIDSNGNVVAGSVQNAVDSLVTTGYVNALNVTAFDALSAQTVVDISSFSTSDISEGSNLYFTAQRARDALQAGTGMDYDAATGSFSTNLVGGEGISVAGDTVSFDGSAISQDIVPSADVTYSLGTPEKMWKDVYIGPGSLYLNGTKILEDNSGTITMNADPGQNLTFGTSGGGSIDLNAGESTVTIKSNLVIAEGKTITVAGGGNIPFADQLDMGGNVISSVAEPVADEDAATKGYVDGVVAAPHVGDKEFSNNVTVQGNLTVQGTTTTVNSETISLADNIIDLNSNVTSGAPSENAGIRVMRGDEAAVQIRWNEVHDHWETYNGTSWTKIALSTSDLVEGSNQYFTTDRVDAIVNPVKAALEAADTAEASARAAADLVLQGNIDSEAATRAAADSDAGVALAAEASARVAGDSDTLAAANTYADGLVSTEISNREAADTSLQNAIDSVASDLGSESDARIAADSDLQVSIDAVAADLQAVVGTSPEALNSLQEIVAAYNSADAGLQQLISDNGVRLTTAESDVDALETQFASLSTSLSSLTATVNADKVDLATETSNRQAADTALDNRVSSLESSTAQLGNDLVSGDSAVLAAAKAHADTGDATLQANIDALSASLSSDISSGDSALNSALNSAISALQSADSTEASTRAAADSDLQSQINSIVSNTDATALNSLSEIVSAFQSADGDILNLVTSNQTSLTDHSQRLVDIESWNTDNISEGIVNQYFTQQRVKDTLSGGLCITFDSLTGEIAIDEAEVLAQLNVKNSTELGGETPEYYRINIYNVAGQLVN